MPPNPQEVHSYTMYISVTREQYAREFCKSLVRFSCHSCQVLGSFIVHVSLEQKHNSVKEFEKTRHSADGFSRSGNEELKKGFTFALEDNGFMLGYSLRQLKPELYVSYHQRLHHCNNSCFTKGGERAESEYQVHGNRIAPLETFAGHLEETAQGRPNVRNPQTLAQNVDHEKRTLGEVLKTMQFKGLLKGSSVEEHRLDFRHSNHSGASCTIGSRRGNLLHEKEAEERQAKTKEKASRKLKASHPADLKPHKKEANAKKVDKIQKVTSVSRNSPEKDIVKSINVLKSQDQGKLTSAKARKHESGSNITKNSTSRQPSTATITISKCSSQNVARNSPERKRNHLRKIQPKSLK
ncbi:hypothetical protein ACFX13_026860 [Malus domestica]